MYFRVHKKKKLLRNFYFILLISLVLNSCSWYDKQEEQPSYLYIDKFSLTTSSTQGSNSDNITDGWIYVNGDPIGVFALPCLIPILKDGSVTFTVFAGVKDDGRSTARNIYPFYTSYEENINLSRGLIDTLRPSCVYFAPPIAKIDKEDFEDAGIKFTLDPTSTVPIVKTNLTGEVKEGQYSGKIEMTSSDFLSKNYYNVNFVFPRNGKSVYVELDYKSNMDFTIGIEVTDPSSVISLDNTSIKASYDENNNLIWKKIYVNLSELVNFHVNATGFRVYVKAVNADAQNGLVTLIDNFKVVYNE